MHISRTPSWPNAEAAKHAWNEIRVSDAASGDKAKAREAYKRCMRKCFAESGIVQALRNRSVR